MITYYLLVFSTNAGSGGQTSKLFDLLLDILLDRLDLEKQTARKLLPKLAFIDYKMRIEFRQVLVIL